MDGSDLEKWLPRLMLGNDLDPLGFLAFFNCSRIPKILFTRASQGSSVVWSDSGEPQSYERFHHGSIFWHSALCGLVSLINEKNREQAIETEGRLWSENYVLTNAFRNRDYNISDTEISKSYQFAILNTIILAFPEPWCELLWEEVEDQLWEVIQSTCVPFLGVLEVEDVQEYLSNSSREEAGQYWTSISKFLIQVASRLRVATPPNFFDLISSGLVLAETTELVPQETLRYLCTLKDILKIVALSDLQPWIAAQKLQELDHHGSKRSNAAIGLALGLLQEKTPILPHNGSQAILTWSPISPEFPSDMELLAQVQIYGVSCISEFPGVEWETLPINTKTLMAFCEVQRKSYQVALAMLKQVIGDIEKSYGSQSLEYVLVSSTLMNCCNATGKEELGEKVGRKTMENLSRSLEVKEANVIMPLQEAYFTLAMADSLLGNYKYDEAETLLVHVLDSPSSPVGMRTSAVLRLTKMSRRQRKESATFDEWRRLRSALDNFSDLSDSLKYECVEEVLCFLSVLDPKDGAKVPEASEIVKILIKYPIQSFKGSSSSRRNLQENLEALEQYRNDIGLFSVVGPELAYCRMMRDRFPQAKIQFIEKIGPQNWQRTNRIKQLRTQTVDEDDEDKSEHLAPLVTSTESVFHDSGLGSSIGSDAKDEGAFITLQVAKSVASVDSHMSHDEDTEHLPPMPQEILEGKPFHCFICEHIIKGVSNRPQWERHIYSDLRPYMCIVEGCSADPTSFASRAEFRIHLVEHQSVQVWKCKNCGHTEEAKQAARDHILLTHSSSHTESDEGISKETVRRDLKTQKCPFCNKIPGEVSFVGHMCHHLEELSLSSVPKEGDLDESDAASNARSHRLSATEEAASIGGQRETASGEQVSKKTSADEANAEDTKDKAFDSIDKVRAVEKTASSHLREGVHSKAEEEYKLVLEGFGKFLGEEHFETVITMSNLAWILQRQGRYDEAQKEYKKAMEIMKRTLSPTHAETLRVVNNLAVVLSDQGQYIEAEKLNRLALRGREDTLGTDHADTLQSINNLAEALDGQDRWEEAETLYQRAIDGRTKKLGSSHIFTQQSLENLTRMRARVGEIEKEKAADGMNQGGRTAQT